MERRQFLTSIPITAAGWGVASAMMEGCVHPAYDETSSSKSRIEKVKLAMLSLQRATWEQGVAMQACLEMGEQDLVILMARDAVLRKSQDGRLAMLGEEFALSDAASPGEAVLWAAQSTGDPTLVNGYAGLLAYILERAPRNSEGIIYHFSNLPQIWSDSIYMLPPFLAAAGKFTEAVRQIDGVRSCLWNPDKHLFSHMWDCDKQLFVRKDFWGVGNGWSAAGITRVIRALPETMGLERTKLIGYVRDILDGCLAYMRPDGLFHNVVDDPQSFVETNLSQMLAYTIYRGIRGGWIDGSLAEKADRMRAAAHKNVDDLGMVQGVCGSPEFDHAGTATEGQAFFLLMEAARRDMT
jgi:unsaturated rhamnogalacturonyl hydrolase